MRILLTPLLVLALCLHLSAQGFVGVNAGGILGRTVELRLMAYPKDQDWISFHAAGGYTAPGPFFFAKKDECLRSFFNNGWHVRAGARQGITADLRRNHFFWGIDLLYSRVRENARYTLCDTVDANDVQLRNRFASLGAAVNVGWTWNVFRRKTVWDRLFIDFGLQLGGPIYNGGDFLSERRYSSGLGYGQIPFRRLHLEPLLVARYELWHGRYGYLRSREVRH